MLLDAAESSALDLRDPARLVFEYMQQMRVILDATMPSGALRVMHLGGAACAFPRAIDAARPGSSQVAVELDGQLAGLVREWFDLPRSPRLRIRVGDAREVLQSQRAGAWQVMVRDVFAGTQVPRPVRTLQAAQAARAALGAEGLYLVNAAHRPPGVDVRAEIAALQRAFGAEPGQVLAVTDPGIRRGRRHGNVVLAAASAGLPVAEIERGLRRLPLPAGLMTGHDLDRFRAGAAPTQDRPGRAPATPGEQAKNPAAVAPPAS